MVSRGIPLPLTLSGPQISASMKENDDLTLQLKDGEGKLEESGHRLKIMNSDRNQHKKSYVEQCRQHIEYRKVQGKLMKHKASLKISLDRASESKDLLPPNLTVASPHSSPT